MRRTQQVMFTDKVAVVRGDRVPKVGATCCHILTRGLDVGAGDYKPHCRAFTGMVAGFTPIDL